LRPDEPVQVGFGADEKVKVTRTNVRRNEASTGIISSSWSEERECKFTIRSAHDQAIRVQIEDQLRVSEIAEVQVDLLPATTPPTHKDMQDRRGVLGWTFDAKPGEARELKLAWRVRWPADKTVFYEPRLP
jgi:uncharacterized protein (TIGR02231 family)